MNRKSFLKTLGLLFATPLARLTPKPAPTVEPPTLTEEQSKKLALAMWDTPIPNHIYTGGELWKPVGVVLEDEIIMGGEFCHPLGDARAQLLGGGPSACMSEIRVVYFGEFCNTDRPAGKVV